MGKHWHMPDERAAAERLLQSEALLQHQSPRQLVSWLHQAGVHAQAISCGAQHQAVLAVVPGGGGASPASESTLLATRVRWHKAWARSPGIVIAATLGALVNSTWLARDMAALFLPHSNATACALDLLQGRHIGTAHLQLAAPTIALALDGQSARSGALWATAKLHTLGPAGAHADMDNIATMTAIMQSSASESDMFPHLWMGQSQDWAPALGSPLGLRVLVPVAQWLSQYRDFFGHPHQVLAKYTRRAQHLVHGWVSLLRQDAWLQGECLPGKAPLQAILQAANVDAVAVCLSGESAEPAPGVVSAARAKVSMPTAASLALHWVRATNTLEERLHVGYRLFWDMGDGSFVPVGQFIMPVAGVIAAMIGVLVALPRTSWERLHLAQLPEPSAWGTGWRVLSTAAGLTIAMLTVQLRHFPVWPTAATSCLFWWLLLPRMPMPRMASSVVIALLAMCSFALATGPTLLPHMLLVGLFGSWMLGCIAVALCAQAAGKACLAQAWRVLVLFSSIGAMVATQLLLAQPTLCWLERHLRIGILDAQTCPVHSLDAVSSFMGAGDVLLPGAVAWGCMCLLISLGLWS